MNNKVKIGIGFAIAFAFAGEAQAQRILRVVGVASNDVLNVREFPSTASRIVGVIPYDAKSVSLSGERQGAWVFVNFRRVEGWVDSRYVVPMAPPIRRGRSYDDDLSE